MTVLVAGTRATNRNGLTMVFDTARPIRCLL
jgi:hypothetical protein